MPPSLYMAYVYVSQRALGALVLQNQNVSQQYKWYLAQLTIARLNHIVIKMYGCCWCKYGAKTADNKQSLQNEIYI